MRLFEQVGAGVADGYSCLFRRADAPGVVAVAHAALIAHVPPNLEQDQPPVAVLGIDETRPAPASTALLYNYAV